MCQGEVKNARAMQLQSLSLTTTLWYNDNDKRLHLLLRPHVYDLKWRIGQLNDVPWFECFGVDIVHVVWMEDAWTGTAQDSLLARWIG